MLLNENKHKFQIYVGREDPLNGKFLFSPREVFSPLEHFISSTETFNNFLQFPVPVLKSFSFTRNYILNLKPFHTENFFTLKFCVEMFSLLCLQPHRYQLFMRRGKKFYV